MAQNLIISNVAAEHGIKDAILAFHVRELHGWNPGETGFFEAVEEVAACKREECMVLIGELEASAVEHALAAAPS
jgi:hypothetical protein